MESKGIVLLLLLYITPLMKGRGFLGDGQVKDLATRVKNKEMVFCKDLLCLGWEK